MTRMSYQHQSQDLFKVSSWIEMQQLNTTGAQFLISHTKGQLATKVE